MKYRKENEKMTNYERIKNMSVEEMAEFICSIYDDIHGKSIEGDIIPDYDQYKVAEWLDWEVKE